jgi:hypothetical protein
MLSVTAQMRCLRQMGVGQKCLCSLYPEGSAGPQEVHYQHVLQYLSCENPSSQARSRWMDRWGLIAKARTRGAIMLKRYFASQGGTR